MALCGALLRVAAVRGRITAGATLTTYGQAVYSQEALIMTET